MPHRRSNRVNNEAYPAFTAAVAQAVADLLPTLTARITDEIRQNENNENNGNQRNSRRGNPEGSRNDGDAQPTDIRVWLERFRKKKPHTFSSASTLVKVESWISHIEKIFEVLGCDDQFKARLATYKLEGDAHSWWRTYKQAKGGDAYVATLSWNDFRNIIFLQYFPYSEKERGLIRELMIEGIVTDMATVADMATGIDMALTNDVVIDRAVINMAMVVTDRKMVVRRRGVTKTSRFGANIIVVLMGHQARADTRIITHVPHVTFMGNFIQERGVTGLLVLALNVERLGIWLKIVRK
ncbi:hypothetical protein Tco_1001445, partial [Tanacetum coccineum]